MIELKEIEEINIALDLIDDLLIKAIKIAQNAPYWQYIYNEEWAKIDVDGDEVILSYFDNEIDCDCPRINTYEFKFPLSLLLISDSELSKFKIEQMKIYEENRIKENEANKKQIENNERIILAKLKQKYESN